MLRNLIPQNKLTTTFDPTEFTVVETTRNEAVVQGDDGRTFRRNLSHRKKIPVLVQPGTENANNSEIYDVEDTTESRNLGLKLNPLTAKPFFHFGSRQTK